MEFRILGPLTAEEEGRQLAPAGHKARALLLLLLLHANESVTADRLVHEIWGDRLPANATKTLQIHISRLRKSIGADRLQTVGGGYKLAVREGELDRDRALSLVERGGRLLDEGDPDSAGAAFREALSLYRGRPLAEFAHEDFAQAELARLEELYVQAQEGRIESKLAMGRGGEVTRDLEALVLEHPLRERLHAQRMLALYQTGRQAKALEAYQDARRRFVDELGLEPGPALQDLERRILNQDPDLGIRRRDVFVQRARESTRRRRRAVGFAGAAIAFGAVLIALAAWQFAEADPALPANSLAMLDPQTLAPAAVLSLGGTPSDVAVGRRSVFVALPARGSVIVVDPRTVATASLGAPVRRPTRLAPGTSGLWVLDGTARRVALLGSARAYRIGAARGRLADQLDAMATSGRSVWLAERNAELLFRLNPRTGRSRSVENRGRDSFFEGDARRTVVAAAGSVWASNPVSAFPATDRFGHVSRLDSKTSEVVASIRLPAPPVAMVGDEQAVWVALERGETVWRIDPRDDVVNAAVRVPGGVIDLAIGEHAVWALGEDGEVSRIDPRSNAITANTKIGRGDSIAAGAGAVWIAAR